VGTTNVRGATVNMQCHESLVYVAAGSSVTAIDLRTMQKVITAAVHQSKLYSFGMVPSKSLIGTGGDGRYDCLGSNLIIVAIANHIDYSLCSFRIVDFFRT
jgi:hypothetical protein